MHLQKMSFQAREGNIMEGKMDSQGKPQALKYVKDWQFEIYSPPKFAYLLLPTERHKITAPAIFN